MTFIHTSALEGSGECWHLTGHYTRINQKCLITKPSAQDLCRALGWPHWGLELQLHPVTIHCRSPFAFSRQYSDPKEGGRCRCGFLLQTAAVPCSAGQRCFRAQGELPEWLLRGPESDKKDERYTVLCLLMNTTLNTHKKLKHSAKQKGPQLGGLFSCSNW